MLKIYSKLQIVYGLDIVITRLLNSQLFVNYLSTFLSCKAMIRWSVDMELQGKFLKNIPLDAKQNLSVLFDVLSTRSVH